MNSLQKESQKCSVLIQYDRTTHYRIVSYLRNEKEQNNERIRNDIF